MKKTDKVAEVGAEQIAGFEAATVANLKKIRQHGALAAYQDCL